MSGDSSLCVADPSSYPFVALWEEGTTTIHSVEETAPALSFQSRMTERRVGDLHPHPAYVRHHLGVSASKLSALVEVGDLAFREPLAITDAGTIIDGHSRWELARLQGRAALPCIEYILSEEEALHWLIQRHGRSGHLNAFCRILLALELEPWLTEQARSHQKAGGENKGSSKLTEADRLDVRSRIAAVAGASTGNVTKVKQLPSESVSHNWLYFVVVVAVDKWEAAFCFPLIHSRFSSVARRQLAIAAVLRFQSCSNCVGLT